MEYAYGSVRYKGIIIVVTNPKPPGPDNHPESSNPGDVQFAGVLALGMRYFQDPLSETTISQWFTWATNSKGKESRRYSVGSLNMNAIQR
jgi:hypothetical protein